jgi:hypothetical protein
MFRHVRVIGGRGQGADRFTTSLRAITTDAQDHLYAVGDSDVKVFGADGTLRRRWPTSSPGYAVAVDAAGRVWVGERGQVEIFDHAGVLSDTWRDEARLGRVTAIGFVNGHVLVGDAMDRAIRRYDARGVCLNTIGKNNRMQGFRIPNGVIDFSVDGDGIIHAANPGKHRIERYTPDDQLLGHIGRFDGIDPAGFAGCCNPTNVTVAGRDRIYVTEKGEPRAKVYDFQGRLTAVIAAAEFDPGCKNMDIAVDRHGRVYVTDTVRLEILAFEGDPAS